jgi:hypothetical protein
MRTIRFSGLRSYLERLLDDVALGASGQTIRGSAVSSLVQRTADRLNYVIERDGISPDDLQSESRELLGWFRYFSKDTRFDSYLLAVERTLTAIKECLAVSRAMPGGETCRRRAVKLQWKPPFLVHFRPTTSLYRWRICPEGTRIMLPTPMITLDRERMVALVRQMCGAGRSAAASEGMLTNAYRQMAADLAAAGGIVDRTVGDTHDLLASFDRVNHEYFGGTLERPRLSWSARETFRKFGHYDFVQDLVMVSRTLDTSEVPSYVVDHVMHHELLHKKHGFRFMAGKRHAHLPEFRREERTFRHYHEADRFLEGLSHTLRCARC